MQTDHIHYLTVLDDTRSIHRAARLLNLTPSYLSRVLKNAEAELGMTLFTRTHEGLQPAAGAEDVLQDLARIDRIFSNIGYPKLDKTQISGNYFLYCRPALSSRTVPQLFRKLAEQFPAITVQYVESTDRQTIETVSQTPHTIGLVVKMAEDPAPELPDNVSMINPLFTTRLAVMVSENHPLAKNRSISLARLLQSDLIFYDSYRNMESNCIYQFLSRRGTPHVKYCINSLITFQAMLQEGKCMTCVGLEGSYGQGLKVIPLQENIEMVYSLLFNKEDTHSPVIQFFKKSLTQLLAQV